MDTLVFAEEDFLGKHGLNKGAMTLADGETQANILIDLQDLSLELRSGGSAANTVWAVSRSGGRAVYTGKVSNDPNGEFYRRDLRAAGIELLCEPLSEDHGPTGTCVVLTTPDAQRTMCTHLGVSVRLSRDDIMLETIKKSKVVYVEGYLWLNDSTRAASEHAMQLARENGALVAFTFSDPFVVESHRVDFERIAREHCDLVFCNAVEVCAFAGTEDLTGAVDRLSEVVDLGFVTHSEHGCFVIDHARIDTVPGFPVRAMDTNGAGDAFAGGTLFALTNGYNARKAGRWGNYLGAQIVQVHGARLQNRYEDHVHEILGPEA